MEFHGKNTQIQENEKSNLKKTITKKSRWLEHLQ